MPKWDSRGRVRGDLLEVDFDACHTVVCLRAKVQLRSHSFLMYAMVCISSVGAYVFRDIVDCHIVFHLVFRHVVHIFERHRYHLSRRDQTCPGLSACTVIGAVAVAL